MVTFAEAMQYLGYYSGPDQILHQKSCEIVSHVANVRLGRVTGPCYRNFCRRELWALTDATNEIHSVCINYASRREASRAEKRRAETMAMVMAKCPGKLFSWRQLPCSTGFTF